MTFHQPVDWHQCQRKPDFYPIGDILGIEINITPHADIEILF